MSQRGEVPLHIYILEEGLAMKGGTSRTVKAGDKSRPRSQGQGDRE